MLAASRGHAECVGVLLLAGDPSQKDSYGESAGDLAARLGHSECSALLSGFERSKREGSELAELAEAGLRSGKRASL